MFGKDDYMHPCMQGSIEPTVANVIGVWSGSSHSWALYVQAVSKKKNAQGDYSIAWA